MCRPFTTHLLTTHLLATHLFTTLVLTTHLLTTHSYRSKLPAPRPPPRVRPLYPVHLTSVVLMVIRDQRHPLPCIHRTEEIVILSLQIRNRRCRRLSQALPRLVEFRLQLGQSLACRSRK